MRPRLRGSIPVDMDVSTRWATNQYAEQPCVFCIIRFYPPRFLPSAAGGRRGSTCRFKRRHASVNHRRTPPIRRLVCLSVRVPSSLQYARRRPLAPRGIRPGALSQAVQTPKIKRTAWREFRRPGLHRRPGRRDPHISHSPTHPGLPAPPLAVLAQPHLSRSCKQC